MLSCTIGDDEGISKLLEQKADINVRRPEGKTCMHLAAHSGKQNCVQVPAPQSCPSRGWSGASDSRMWYRCSMQTTRQRTPWTGMGGPHFILPRSTGTKM